MKHKNTQQKTYQGGKTKELTIDQHITDSHFSPLLVLRHEQSSLHVAQMPGD